MEQQYKGRTYNIRYVETLIVATWRGYSAEAYSIGTALEVCHQMIEKDIREQDDE